MAKKLDRSRGFGEVFGHDGNVAFIQGEAMFDIDGNEIVAGASEEADVTVAEPKKRGPKKAEHAVVDDQLAANMQGVTGDAA